MELLNLTLDPACRGVVLLAPDSKRRGNPPNRLITGIAPAPSGSLFPVTIWPIVPLLRVAISLRRTPDLMRFLLIDRIHDFRPGEYISATKSVSLAEEYLQDHFPGFPILPGVLMVECLTQAAAWLMRLSEDFKYSTILLKEAKAVKFNSFVSPGQSINIECTLAKREGNLYTFKATGTRGDTSVVSARITLEQSNIADSNPRMAASDETQREFFRSLAAGLWTPPAA